MKIKFTFTRACNLPLIETISVLVFSLFPMWLKQENHANIQNVLLEATSGKIHLTTTNLDLGIRCSIKAEVAEESSTTLPSDLSEL